MSSLRNAVKRVAHKERAQPAARKKLGLLEKHKDYVERSRDFHKKQDYIKTLKRKAEERNPDEFYFKMNNSKVVNGVHKEIKDKSLDTSTVQHLKTQDLGYVIHKKAVNDRKVERMKKIFALIFVFLSCTPIVACSRKSYCFIRHQTFFILRWCFSLCRC